MEAENQMSTNERGGEPGYRVLVVDDQTAIRDLLEHRLETEGFDVETVSDGRAALERLREGSFDPDAVVLDISMPAMDGFETLRRIQGFDRPPLVVMVSGRSNEREQIRAFELGAVDYVTKPFKLRVLVARLKSHLDRQRRRSGRNGATPGLAAETETEPHEPGFEMEPDGQAKKEAEMESCDESSRRDADSWPGSWTPGMGRSE